MPGKKYPEFYWLHLYTNLNNLIDFKESIFYSANTIGTKKDKLNIGSIQEYEKLRIDFVRLLGSGAQRHTYGIISTYKLNLLFQEVYFSHL